MGEVLEAITEIPRAAAFAAIGGAGTFDLRVDVRGGESLPACVGVDGDRALFVVHIGQVGQRAQGENVFQPRRVVWHALAEFIALFQKVLNDLSLHFLIHGVLLMPGGSICQ